MMMLNATDRRRLQVKHAYKVFSSRLSQATVKNYFVPETIGVRGNSTTYTAIECLFVDRPIEGFSTNSNGRPQFDVTKLLHLPKRCRIMATNLPLILDRYIATGTVIDEPSSTSTITSSHLCHHDRCINLTHIAYESLEVNKSRNFCLGKEKCVHAPICIRAGRGVRNVKESTGQLATNIISSIIEGTSSQKSVQAEINTCPSTIGDDELDCLIPVPDVDLMTEPNIFHDPIGEPTSHNNSTNPT